MISIEKFFLNCIVSGNCVPSKQIKSDPKQLTNKLVNWYLTVQRDLPWRNTSDPYAIWLSEIMLQQTQVNTVIPYYHQFLQLFPTVSDLAKADWGDVIKAWEGLGYYARARNMHKAAQIIVENHKGQFPNKFDDILALTGIGQSTAGAISTFAFKKPRPILDGNVKRVLSRLEAIKDPIEDKNVIEALWKVSESLLPKKDPQQAYYLNQALMELGATCCTPKNPQCNKCPWVEECKAHKESIQDLLPNKQKKLATPHYTIAVGVIWDKAQQKVLIALRPETGLLAGMWEFPGGKCEDNETLAQCVVREIKEETGLVVEVASKLGEVKHAYTHFKITMHAFHCQLISGKAKPQKSQEIRWVKIDELEAYAFPKANKVILQKLIQSQQDAVAIHQLVLV